MNIEKMIILLICLVTLISIATMPIKASEAPLISAEYAIVYEPRSKTVLYSKNSNGIIQMASTTKIMSTIITLESGNIDDTFEVDDRAIIVEGSSMGLRAGDIVSKRLLCYGMMLPSGNDAANAAAVAVSGDINKFVELMNLKAKELGMLNTRFVTPSGLDDYTDDHYSTAYDMALLTSYALENDIFREICSTKDVSFSLDNGRDIWLHNSNKLLSTLKDCIGVKTGFTDKAGRCLISCVKRGNDVLICCTFNAPNDWEDHSRLYSYIDDNYDLISIDEMVFNVSVAGDYDSVIKIVSQKDCVVLPKSDAINVTRIIYLPKFIYKTELNKNESFGRVEYYNNGQLIYSSKLQQMN